MHYVAIANAIGFSIALEPENSELNPGSVTYSLCDFRQNLTFLLMGQRFLHLISWRHL